MRGLMGSLCNAYNVFSGQCKKARVNKTICMGVMR